MVVLKMEQPMDNWNDARLDELSRRVDDGFEKVDQRFKEVDQRFKEVDQRFDGIDRRFDGVATKAEMGEVKADLVRLNEKFDRLLYALGVGGISFGIAVFGTLGGLVATQI